MISSIFGGGVSFFFCDQIEAMRTNAASLEYLEVEGKHHAHLTHPERVAGPISRFLSDSETQ